MSFLHRLLQCPYSLVFPGIPSQGPQTKTVPPDWVMNSVPLQMAARTHRGDKRGGGNPGKVPQLHGCDQAGRGCMGGVLTCAIPPTFGEVGAMVILKTVESVCFFLLMIEKCGRKNTTANHQPRVCTHEITLVENTKEMGKYIS